MKSFISSNSDSKIFHFESKFSIAISRILIFDFFENVRIHIKLSEKPISIEMYFRIFSEVIDTYCDDNSVF